MELKPCPFCGSENVCVHDTSYGNYLNIWFYVVCRTCGGRAKPCRTKEDAIEAWNMRKENK